ncbi:Crp/Fnr family transcriptional regulator [Sphingobacterium sp. N143]|uniref:Crp/Fnr family transcriptional regulator n=1 Tax=Sphingobacterium sp. N143 TaxID=2746727 RepID=UPI0025770E57|nr:Crp/Fnr family transcriptional regulator [Sphingobacterium sp. N143]MDM1295335.1 Crp/Fnr family transcriptional regulator [Sphingobacterium sp. N143]
MHPLFHYVNKYTVISEEDFKVFISYFTPRRVRKKQYLLEEGEISKHIAFITKGSMRQYYTDEKGIEHIVNLYIENWWVCDRESFAMGTPSIYSIDAWEHCEVLLISKENSIKLRSQCPAFNELFLRLDELNTIATQRRITYSISFTAEIHFKYFIDNYPYFVDRFPQHVIASYLGITKDTLSRIRNKIIKQRFF